MHAFIASQVNVGAQYFFCLTCSVLCIPWCSNKEWETLAVCVFVCVWMRVCVCFCVCVWMRVWVKECVGERVRVCVCLREREREWWKLFRIPAFSALHSHLSWISSFFCLHWESVFFFRLFSFSLQTKRRIKVCQVLKLKQLKLQTNKNI